METPFLVIGFAIAIGVVQHHYLIEFHHAPCFGRQRLTGTSDQCGYLAVDLSRITAFNPFVRAAGFIIGPLVGAIIGIVAIASDLDNRTARFAWTQSVSRWQWFEAKIGVGALLVAIILVPTAITLSWWDGASADSARMSRFSFELAGWNIVAYGLFAFALTAFVGSVIRRTGWTLAGVVVLYLAVTFTVPTEIRPHLAPITVIETPLVTSSGLVPQPSMQPNAIQIAYGVFPRDYHGPFTTSELLTTSSRLASCLGNYQGQSTADGTQIAIKCYRKLKVWNVSDSGNDQFWTLQLREGLLYLGTGLILIGGAYVFVRRIEP
jgi:hypothetical protein